MSSAPGRVPRQQNRRGLEWRVEGATVFGEGLEDAQHEQLHGRARRGHEPDHLLQPAPVHKILPVGA